MPTRPIVYAALTSNYLFPRPLHYSKITAFVLYGRIPWSFVSMLSQLGTGGHLNVWVPVNWLRRNQCANPKKKVYFCRNRLGTKYPEGIYSLNEVRQSCSHVCISRIIMVSSSSFFAATKSPLGYRGNNGIIPGNFLGGLIWICWIANTTGSDTLQEVNRSEEIIHSVWRNITHWGQ